MTRTELLTPRQIDVLALLAAGLRSREIADELHVSYETIRSYEKTIRQDLRAHTLAHAVALGFERGLLPR